MRINLEDFRHLRYPCDQPISHEESGCLVSRILSGDSLKPLVFTPITLHACRLDKSGRQLTGTFIPTQSLPHEIKVQLKGQLVENCPLIVEVSPDFAGLSQASIGPCSLNSLVDIMVSSWRDFWVSRFSTINFHPRIWISQSDTKFPRR